MTTRRASCACGQLHVECEGEPVRISVCYCTDCQRRTGSAFGAQARFARAQITKIDGPVTTFERVADSGNRLVFRFCPSCGTTVFWENQGMPGVMAVALGAFADGAFPEPTITVYEARRPAWLPPLQ